MSSVTAASSQRGPGAALPMAASVSTAIALGLVLGGFAVAVDEVSLSGPARILVVVVSSGLSWLAAAVAVGALSRGRGTAAVAGLAVLASAVLTYYLGIHVLGLRSDAGWNALLRAAQIWLVGAVIAGPVAGLAGWHARFGDHRARPVAWGLLCGLLLGQGLRWAWQYGLAPDVVFTSAVVVPLAILAWAVRRGGALYAVPVVALSAVLSAAALEVIAATL